MEKKHAIDNNDSPLVATIMESLQGYEDDNSNTVFLAYNDQPYKEDNSFVDVHNKTITETAAHAKVFSSHHFKGILIMELIDDVVHGVWIQHSLPSFPKMPFEENNFGSYRSTFYKEPKDMFTKNLKEKAQMFACYSFSSKVKVDADRSIHYSRADHEKLIKEQAHVAILNHLETMHVPVIAHNYRDFYYSLDKWKSKKKAYEMSKIERSHLPWFKYFGLSTQINSVKFSMNFPAIIRHQNNDTSPYRPKKFTPPHLFPLGVSNKNVNELRSNELFIGYNDNTRSSLNSKRDSNNADMGKCHIFGKGKDSDVDCITNSSFVTTGHHYQMTVYLLAKNQLVHVNFWDEMVSRYMLPSSYLSQEEKEENTKYAFKMMVQSWSDARTHMDRSIRVSFVPNSSKYKDIIEIANSVGLLFKEASGKTSFMENYYRDHSKWALMNAGKIQSNGEHEIISTLKMVCIGDLNRCISQDRRGGGVSCFQTDGYTEAFAKLIPSVVESREQISLETLLNNGYLKREEADAWQVEERYIEHEKEISIPSEKGDSNEPATPLNASKNAANPFPTSSSSKNVEIIPFPNDSFDLDQLLSDGSDNSFNPQHWASLSELLDFSNESSDSPSDLEEDDQLFNLSDHPKSKKEGSNKKYKPNEQTVPIFS